MLILQIENLTVAYRGLASPVLAVPSFRLGAGEGLAVTGASGSGKTTFVNRITGLEAVESGHVRWGNEDLATLSEGARDRFRAAHIGLVMQEFHLFPGLSALENVLLPARLARAVGRADVTRAGELLLRFGLKRPDQDVKTMSRGEMQRVAVARALLRRPGVIVADEPTASLDTEAGAAVTDLLLSVAKEEGSSLIVVTHDPRLMARLPRRIELAAGVIVQDSLGEAA
ncbi:ABC transporter ATP-binding protein [Rhizobium paknamense]|uniref:ABC transport system ATP-binding protein n=1 Tax=Rhizobium paknamense TaxID=1206817 RepID=A0ABU0IFB3_9HYPH|nr:ATP-binding cassette domain-containing protein [Rhizobium paknamense]MDQ0456915.1 putative ABC transport system ATP-binding protein [Rhizobium paknamense]